MQTLLAIVAVLLTAAVVVQGLAMRRRVGDPVDTEAQAELGRQREELRVVRGQLDERENRLMTREERVGAMSDAVHRDRERLIADRDELDRQHAQLRERSAQTDTELVRIAGLSMAQARAEVLAAAEAAAQLEALQLAREITAEAVAKAEVSARKVITTAIERIAAQQISDAVVTTVEVPSEEMKGRIIGREGRNIRVFEQVTGVTLMIDDTPGLVLLSSFDPVRREIARRTLTELISDGRIHPARVEEVHEQASREVEQACVEAAERAIERLGLQGIDRDLFPTIGALNYRTSYGQNVLEHSIECAQLAGAMAAELGLNIDICRRAAFLHDLGKAVVTQGVGSHAAEGAELARRYGQEDEVVHAIAAHHNEIAVQTAVDVLTQAADAISSSRPGARRESLEAYVQRLDKLEEIASKRDGVDKAFAIQAGREIRVMVIPEQVDDLASQQLARQIAAEIEHELTYPGRIKVTVVRESRATEFAQ